MGHGLAFEIQNPLEKVFPGMQGAAQALSSMDKAQNQTSTTTEYIPKTAGGAIASAGSGAAAGAAVGSVVAGAKTGSAAGPWGAVVGGIVGLLAYYLS